MRIQRNVHSDRALRKLHTLRGGGATDDDAQPLLGPVRVTVCVEKCGSKAKKNPKTNHRPKPVRARSNRPHGTEGRVLHVKLKGGGRL